jgi:photosystem II stability/assembly factor-like uncharacterized protein
MFVIVGSNGSIVTSSDGNTWEKRTSPVSYHLTTTVYENETFVSVESSGAIITSPDGITWEKQSTGTSTTNYHIIHANGMFVAMGRSTITSSDGFTWAV